MDSIGPDKCQHWLNSVRSAWRKSGTKTVIWGVVGGLVLLMIMSYYLWSWRSPSQFASAIDHCDLLFCDFVGHYYLMGRNILQVAEPVPGYYYSAFFALLLVPFGLLPPQAAVWAWGTVQFVFFFLLCMLPIRALLKLSPKGVVLYGTLCLTSLPILHNLKWGQVSVLIAACVLAAFHSYAVNRRVLAGVLLAFATAIKFYPGLFLLYFVLKRDWRVLASFMLAGLVFFVVVPAAILGPSEWVGFEKAVGHELVSASWGSQDVNSQYIVHVGLRWAGSLFPSYAGSKLALGLMLLGFAAVATTIPALWVLHRRGVRSEGALALVVLFLSTPFLIKTSWPHYFLYLPFCQTLILSHLIPVCGTRRAWPMVLSAVTLSSMALSSVFVFNLFPYWSQYSASGLLFIANALLLVPLYSIASGRIDGRARGMPATASSRAPSPATPQP